MGKTQRLKFLNETWHCFAPRRSSAASAFLTKLEMKVLIGKKIGMSQVFSESGEAIPVTLIVATPNVICLRRKKDRDGYEAVQLGLPQLGKKSSAGAKGKQSKGQEYIAKREFRGELDEKVEQLGVEQFEPGDVVTISGISKGKGFQGVVKRHGFKGGPASHGHRHVLRSPGSIGSRYPQHVLKGMRMAGRMGTDAVTVKNLSVVQVDSAKNLLVVKGAVPGRRGGLVTIKTIDT